MQNHQLFGTTPECALFKHNTESETGGDANSKLLCLGPLCITYCVVDVYMF